MGVPSAAVEPKDSMLAAMGQVSAVRKEISVDRGIVFPIGNTEGFGVSTGSVFTRRAPSRPELLLDGQQQQRLT
ncbi:hypothetical protein GCM10027054_20090 [Isoptericola nanjingensis]